MDGVRIADGKSEALCSRFLRFLLRLFGKGLFGGMSCCGTGAELFVGVESAGTIEFAGGEFAVDLGEGLLNPVQKLA